VFETGCVGLKDGGATGCLILVLSACLVAHKLHVGLCAVNGDRRPGMLARLEHIICIVWHERTGKERSERENALAW
jgi:hypothetical protein